MLNIRKMYYDLKYPIYKSSKPKNNHAFPNHHKTCRNQILSHEIVRRLVYLICKTLKHMSGKCQIEKNRVIMSIYQNIEAKWIEKWFFFRGRSLKNIFCSFLKKHILNCFGNFLWKEVKNIFWKDSENVTNTGTFFCNTRYLVTVF